MQSWNQLINRLLDLMWKFTQTNQILFASPHRRPEWIPTPANKLNIPEEPEARYRECTYPITVRHLVNPDCGLFDASREIDVCIFGEINQLNIRQWQSNLWLWLCLRLSLSEIARWIAIMVNVHYFVFTPLGTSMGNWKTCILNYWSLYSKTDCNQCSIYFKSVFQDVSPVLANNAWPICTFVCSQFQLAIPNPRPLSRSIVPPDRKSVINRKAGSIAIYVVRYPFSVSRFCTFRPFLVDVRGCVNWE